MPSSNHALLVAALLAASCRGEEGARPDDVLALSDVQSAIQERAKAVRDYDYRGEATNLDGGDKVAFRYRLKQPDMLRADVEAIGTRMIFDGGRLSLLDDHERRALVQDLAALDDGQRATALHQVFGDYACEGWRPPLVRIEPGANSARRDDERWLLTTRVDDGELAEVRYTLRAPAADFLKKEFIARDGSVAASTTVLEEIVDDESGLRFPRAWRHEGKRRKVRVELSSIAINDGLPAADFDVTPPEGYTLQRIPR